MMSSLQPRRLQDSLFLLTSMTIRKNRIRNLANYLPGLKKGQKFTVAIEVQDGIHHALRRVGFPQILEDGHRILPRGIGPVSEFNANGRDEKLPNLPKVSKSFMVYTTWNDWHGDPHSGFQHRSVMAFQVKHIPGPAHEITITKKNGKTYAVSSVLTHSPANEEENLHVVNLFLEIFKSCEILDENIALIALPKLKTLNWRILPKGRYPWDRAKGDIEKVTRGLSDEKRFVIEDRLKLIASFQPDFVAIGEGGFSGYFVMGFSDRALFVFESIYLGNATYVFDKGWESVSKLTKGQIINQSLHRHRIVHTARWRRDIRSLLSG